MPGAPCRGVEFSAVVLPHHDKAACNPAAGSMSVRIRKPLAFLVCTYGHWHTHCSHSGDQGLMNIQQLSRLGHALLSTHASSCLCRTGARQRALLGPLASYGHYTTPYSVPPETYQGSGGTRCTAQQAQAVAHSLNTRRKPCIEVEHSAVPLPALCPLYI
jgi:hypothetical protein